MNERIQQAIELTKDKVGCIYAIKNTINDKVYIGQTTMTLHERFLCHMKPSTQKERSCYKFYKAIQEIGEDNFYIEEIESNIPVSQLDAKEVYYIKKYDSYKNGYNSTNGGKDREINDENEVKKIIQMYENGMSSKEISNIYGVCSDTILRTVHDFGYYPQIYPNVTKEDLQRYMGEGLSHAEIAKIYHCHPDSIKRYKAKFGLRQRKEYFNFNKDFNLDAFLNDVNQGISKEEICEKYNMSKTTYQKYINQNTLAKGSEMNETSTK